MTRAFPRLAPSFFLKRGDEINPYVVNGVTSIENRLYKYFLHSRLLGGLKKRVAMRVHGMHTTLRDHSNQVQSTPVLLHVLKRMNKRLDSRKLPASMARLIRGNIW